MTRITARRPSGSSVPRVAVRASQRSFLSEKRFFDLLRSCTPAARREYEEAIKSLLERYNTTIFENRFTVGGAVEAFTYALLRSVGVSCTLYGDQAHGGDILLPNDRKLSVKGSFGGVEFKNNKYVYLKPVRLINQMGRGKRKWDTATLFVISGIGIVFGAPSMVTVADLKSTGDSVELRTSGLRTLLAAPSNIIHMNIAKKPPTETTGRSEKGSLLIAHQILCDTQANNLLKAFP